MKSPKSNGNGSRTSQSSTALILSVDDEPGILATRQAILECEGYAVLSAADGDQALVYFETQPIDLVLLDYAMPGKNGGLVCREMKKAKPHVPVIMVSANLVDGDTLMRVDHFISKGDSPRLLLEKVRELLNQTRCMTDDRRPGRNPLHGSAARVTKFMNLLADYGIHETAKSEKRQKRDYSLW